MPPRTSLILFTDLVGSTELTAALTPDAADELRRAHFSALRQAITASGGTEVKSLGDGLMVVFPIASAALSCAVAMQQAVDRDNRNAIRVLDSRVGISAGEVTREADDYFGEPVIEAARLCAACRRRPNPGGGTRPGHGWSPQPVRLLTARCARSQGFARAGRDHRSRAGHRWWTAERPARYHRRRAWRLCRPSV